MITSLDKTAHYVTTFRLHVFRFREHWLWLRRLHVNLVNGSVIDWTFTFFSPTSNCQCCLFSEKNLIIRIFCTSGRLAVSVNPHNWSSTLLKVFQTEPGSPSSFLFDAYRSYFPGGEAVGSWSWAPSPSSAKLKNGWCYTSTPLCPFVLWTKISTLCKWR